MAFTWLLILALQFIHHLAWPLVALGYPICASVQAIETDSYEETRNLISYWILFSLIYLFEYAFLRLLQLFQFWPHIKLMIVFWLIIPDFRRASFVYTYVIRSCFDIKPQALISRLIDWIRFFVNKGNFLLNAERYIDENGAEALEKLTASKNVSKLDAEATYNEEMQETNGERFQTEHKAIKDLEVTIKATDNEEMSEVIGKELQIEHKDIKELEVVEKKGIPAGKQTNGERFQTEHKDIKDLEVTIKANDNEEMREVIGKELQIEHKDIKELEMVEKKGIPAGKQDIPLEPNLTPPSQKISYASEVQCPERSSSTDNEVQNGWTCLLCQVTTTSKITWKSHLRGRKHRAGSEALRTMNQATSHKTINQPNNKTVYGPVKVNNSKFRCQLCDVNCKSEVDFASHLVGKRHIAHFQV